GGGRGPGRRGAGRPDHAPPRRPHAPRTPRDPVSRRVQIAVAGGGVCGRTTERLAHELGREIAAAGAVLVCGGLGGVMEAAARGAAEAGGLLVGLLPRHARAAGDRWLTPALPSRPRRAPHGLVAPPRAAAPRPSGAPRQPAD